MLLPSCIAQFPFNDALLTVNIYSKEGVTYEANTPYAVDHSKVPVLVLHGNGSNHHEFNQLIKCIYETRTVIAPDTRLQGASPAGDTPLTYELFARDVIEILDRLGVSRVHVVGFSDGGITGILLARDYPIRVMSLTALGPNIDPECEDPETTEAFFEELQAIQTTLDPKIQYRLDALMAQEPHISPESLADMSVPTLIMAGEKDIIKADHIQLIANSIPGARLHIVKGSGHFLLTTKPQETIDAICKFINEDTYVAKYDQTPQVSQGISIRKLTLEDLPLQLKLNEDLFLGDVRYTGWVKGVYPTAQQVEDNLRSGGVYGAFDTTTGDLLASIGLRQDCNVELEACGWKRLPAQSTLMIHLLMSDPTVRRRGLGATMLAVAEDVARQLGCSAIRLNTPAQNLPANSLYRKYGYKLWTPALFPYPELPLSYFTNLWEKQL